MTENNPAETDLSAGNSTSEDTVLTQVLLSEQQQKETFRNRSFVLGWFFSGLFFISVLAFSWSIIFCPNVFLLTKAIHSVEQSTISQPSEAKKKPAATNTKRNTPVVKKNSEVEGKDQQDQQGTLFNQFLIMLALLSAIGTTLAIAVMRFSFSNDKDSGKEISVVPISPIASSMAELLSQVAELIKKK